MQYKGEKRMEESKKYEVTEIKVKRHSSMPTYDVDDCKITQSFGGYNSYYFDSKEEAEEFIYDLYGKMFEPDQYNRVFVLSEVYYDEIEECYLPTNHFNKWFDLWKDNALDKWAKDNVEEIKND